MGNRQEDKGFRESGKGLKETLWQIEDGKLGKEIGSLPSK